MDDALISVAGLWKKYPRSLEAAQRYTLRDSFGELVDRRHGEGLRDEEAWVLRDVGFELRRGECLGVIGPNGAGKTTLLRALAGLIKPDRGKVTTRGRVERLISLGGGFEPLLSGRENVRLQASLMGIKDRDLDRMLDEVVAFSELEESIDSPVQFYSSGMRARLGFATSAMTRPDVLLLDEITAVGDLRFRIKCYDRIREMAEEAAVVFVSHSMPQVRRLCTTACYLENGIVALHGDVDDVVECYEKSVDGFEDDRPTRKSGTGALPVAVCADRRLLAHNDEIACGASIRVAVDTGVLPENVRFHVAVSPEQSAAADAVCFTRAVRSAGSVVAVNLGPVTLPAGTCRVTVRLLSPDGTATIARADPVPLAVVDTEAAPDMGIGDGWPAFVTWSRSPVADADGLPLQLVYDPDSDNAGEEGLASGQPCLRPMQFIDPELDARLAARMERYRTDRLTGIAEQEFRKHIERFLQGVDFAMEGYGEHELDRQRDLSIKFHWGHNHDFGPFSLSGRLGDRHIRLLRNFICAFPVTEESLSGLRVLDVGCWTGGTTLMLASLGARVTGIEEVKKYADVAGFLARSFGTEAEILQTSVYDLSSPPDFDLIYYAGVAYHVSDPVLSLRILYNATRMGGAILVESAGVNAAGSLCHYEGCKVFRKGAKEDLNRGGWNWFIPSPLALARMMWMAGYDDIRMMWISSRLYGYGRKLAQNPITRAGLSRRTVS